MEQYRIDMSLAQLLRPFLGFLSASLLLLALGFPLSSWISNRLGALDQPGALKVHSRPMPRLGGIGIALSGSIAFYLISDSAHAREIFAILFIGITFFAIGIIDDLRDIPQVVKFPVEGIVTFAFVALTFPDLPYWLYIMIWLWTMAIANGYNFIDGIDGLASGTAVTNLLALGLLLFASGARAPAILACSVAGASFGFFLVNRAPARIFMGDGGALFLGAMVAALSALYMNMDGFSVQAIIAVVLAAGFPAGDAVFTFVRRLVVFRSLSPGQVFLGDRGHSYDQVLMNSGYSVARTAGIFHVASGYFAVLGVLAGLTNWSVSVLCFILAAVPVTYLVLRFGIRLRWVEEA